MAKQPKKPNKPAKSAPKKAKTPKTTTKAAKGAKPKPAKKPPTGTAPKAPARAKPKAPTKPRSKKARTAVSASLGGVHAQDGGGGGANAVPVITAPLAGAPVPAGTNLPVTVNTNRADLQYIIVLTDVTPPPPPPAPPLPPVPPVPCQVNVTPTGNNFTGTIPGANIAPGRVYRIRVFVNPTNGGTPPNQDFTINVNT